MADLFAALGLFGIFLTLLPLICVVVYGLYVMLALNNIGRELDLTNRLLRQLIEKSEP